MKTKAPFIITFILSFCLLLACRTKQQDNTRWLAAASRWIQLDETVATSDNYHVVQLRDWAKSNGVKLTEVSEGGTVRFHKK